MRRTTPALLLLLAALAGCSDDGRAPAPTDEPQQADVPDPLEPGNLTVAESSYDFGYTVLTDPTTEPYQYPSTVSGSLAYPESGGGPFPLILLMHGRHGTCAILGNEMLGTHVCPDAVVVTPVNSYTGYADLARNLASHGYVVASVNANHVNDRDAIGDAGADARAQLLLYTLGQFQAVNETGGPATAPLPALQGRIDLSRIGLMGHSRGGEGVTRAITLNQERGSVFAIRAVFALAPTDFARWEAPGVAFATLLPYCDGDVYNLQGAWIYDDARGLAGGPRYQVLAMGANHNFYNTVWTGDDWGTGGEWCGSAEAATGRDTPESQRAHGYGLMASFLRLHAGGERAFAPLWDGGEPWPDTFCPGWDGCADRLLLSRQPMEAERFEVAPDGASDAYGGADVSQCAGSDCFQSMYSVAQATRYEWTGSLALHFRVQDAPAGLGTFSFRVALPPGQAALDLDVVFRAAGGNATVALGDLAALDTPPMGEDAKGILSMVEVPLPAGMAAEDLRAVELRSASPGAMVLADVMLQR